jgi:hypothetical protein
MKLSPFQTWVETTAPKAPVSEVVAYNFNMSEPALAGWSIELIGAKTYDADDPDWSCPPEVWTSRPRDFSLSRADHPTWDVAQQFVLEEVRAFIELSPSASAAVLRNAKAVCVAFVDGDHSMIWPKHEERHQS